MSEPIPLSIETAEVESHPKACVLRLFGNLDSKSTAHFEAQIQELIASGKQQLIINGKNLDFISSAGIGVLFGALASLEETNGKVLLAEIEGTELFETFKILHYLDMFPICNTEADAIARLGTI